jgi:hypothetical protein
MALGLGPCNKGAGLQFLAHQVGQATEHQSRSGLAFSLRSSLASRDSRLPPPPVAHAAPPAAVAHRPLQPSAPRSGYAGSPYPLSAPWQRRRGSAAHPLAVRCGAAGSFLAGEQSKLPFPNFQFQISVRRRPPAEAPRGRAGTLEQEE